jgi:hypothetical protein
LGFEVAGLGLALGLNGCGKRVAVELGRLNLSRDNHAFYTFLKLLLAAGSTLERVRR